MDDVTVCSLGVSTPAPDSVLDEFLVVLLIVLGSPPSGFL
jgi:hypothetical protein